MTGQRFVEFSSVLQIEVNNENLAVSTPIEEGSFANYNKVGSPLDIGVTLAFQGEEFELQLALETLNSFADGLELVTLVTPTAIYDDLNLEIFSYKRNAEDGILVCECHFIEVRQVETDVTTTNYTVPKCKNPSSVTTQDTGTANVEPPRNQSVLLSGKEWAKGIH